MSLDLKPQLSQDHVKAIAVMGLVETLVIHLQEIWPDKKSEQYRSLKGMLNNLNQVSKTMAGHVPEHMIELADRFLIRTQAAFDGFWDEMSEADREQMEAVKAEWGVGVEPDQVPGG